MIYITQLIYIVEGQEKVFNEFESLAMSLLSNHNGCLLLRVRPTENNFIEFNMATPYEIHLVEFKTQEDFESFMQDKERKLFLQLKSQSIKDSVVIQGVKL